MPPCRSDQMPPASKATLLLHREIAALIVTYGLFVGGILVLAWSLA